jgi:hypothetical protein
VDVVAGGGGGNPKSGFHFFNEISSDELAEIEIMTNFVHPNACAEASA